MPVRDIRTRLSLDGEKEFKAALNDAQRAMRVMGSELKAASAEFEATGNREQLLTTRSRVLRQEVEQQEAIIKALGQAVTDSASRYGEADRRTDGYRIKLNNAAASLSRMRKELEDTDREAEELGRDSRRVGSQIKDGIGGAADETQGKLEDMFAALSRDVGNIRGSVTISAVTDIADVVGGALSSVAGFVDQYAEERRSQAILGFNARRAGLDDERIQALRAEVTALTGDSDTALEALSNLIATGWDIQNIEFAAKSLIGAEITFPETLQAESLAESIQKTISNPEGTAEGEILDLVSMLEQNTEEFQASIKEAGTAVGRANVILGLLNHDVLQEGYNAFINDPEVQGVLNGARAKQALNDEVTELSGHMADNIVTPATEAGATFVGLINTFLEQGWEGFKESVGKAMEAARAGETEKQREAQDYTAVMRAEAQNLETQAMQALEAGDGLTYYSLITERDALMTEIAEVEAFVLERLDRLGEIDKDIATLESQAAAADEAGNTHTADLAREKIDGLMSEAETLQAELNAKWRELGAGAVESMDEGMSQQGEALTQTAYSTGEAAGVSLGNGIAAARSYAVGQMAAMITDINAEADKLRVPDVAGALASASQAVASATGRNRGGNVNVNVQVDGRTVARASAPYMDAEMGRLAQRNA